MCALAAHSSARDALPSGLSASDVAALHLRVVGLQLGQELPGLRLDAILDHPLRLASLRKPGWPCRRRLGLPLLPPLLLLLLLLPLLLRD